VLRTFVYEVVDVNKVIAVSLVKLPSIYACAFDYSMYAVS